MTEKTSIHVNSEIDNLKGVIIHTPGNEVENMIPENAERALYSDILNLRVAALEHKQLSGVLERITQTFYLNNLLKDVLTNEKVKHDLIHQICLNEDVAEIEEYLQELTSSELARQLIEGVVMKKDTLTKFLDPNRYVLKPLHNFFFTRDAAVSIGDEVFISKMASNVRSRETLIMETIFNFSPYFHTRTVNPCRYAYCDPAMTIEGGDVLTAGKDILLTGMSSRTNSKAIDFFIERFKRQKINKHILVQELPQEPESFIHLDMVFTFLDKDKIMVYEPLILQNNRYQTLHVFVNNGRVEYIRREKNLPSALGNLGFELEPVLCGGNTDDWNQKREQWHSGANFFAVGPGKVIGYERNINTIEALSRHGFEVLRAKDVLNEKVNPANYDKYVITIHGSELSRGGGGARCMTMPVSRSEVS